jgi:hypothetical protein
MSECFFCAAELQPATAENVGRAGRTAYDPHLGRVWRVCDACQRWNVVPLEDRWDVLESCERLSRDRGSILLSGDHLSLIAVGEGQLVRVGAAPRPDFADWRYSSRLDEFAPQRRSLLSRVLLTLPEPLIGGYDLHGSPLPVPTRWMGSPFLAHGTLLTAIFFDIPLAEHCAACDNPLMIEPVEFATLRLVRERGEPAVLANCGLCTTDVAVRLRDARAALRAGLAVVSRRHRDPGRVGAAVRPLERAGGPDEFVARLAARATALGELPAALRLALWLSLDEQAEREALEAEWRQAEDLAGIIDSELTEVPGFQQFRERVLREAQ